MRLIIDKKYLLIPVSTGASKKVILFYHGNEVVYELSARIDLLSPEYFFPVDMHIFQNMVLDVSCIPDMQLTLAMVNTKPELPATADRYRPFWHFTAKYGWINDPNGLVYIEGNYHMFYQHNPVGTEWGNMHWGHAISPDLFHWQEQGIALYPDRMGNMFSGSAIIDKENKSGLSENGVPAVLLYYTTAGNTSKISENMSFAQCIAYSTDGGKNFKKYKNNPVISHIEAYNRDPKVIFSPELNKYVMVLFIDEHKYYIFVSDNLLQWEKLQEVILPEDSECPDFFPLAVDGRITNIKWVFCGASDYYLVGSMKNGMFVVEQEPKRLFHGKVSYAAQTFSNVPDGRRIRISWNKVGTANFVFNGQMGIPCDLSLIEDEGEYLICANPVREIVSIYENTHIEKNFSILPEKPFKFALKHKAYDINFTILDTQQEDFTLSLFGQVIHYSKEKSQIIYMDNYFPAKIRKGDFTLRMIIDKLSFELFIDSGSIAICCSCICDYNISILELSAKEEICIDSLSISELGS